MDIIQLKDDLQSLFPGSSLEIVLDDECQVSIELHKTAGSYNLDAVVVYGYAKPVVDGTVKPMIKILPHRVTMPLKKVWEQLPDTPPCFVHPNELEELAILLKAEELEINDPLVPRPADKIKSLCNCGYMTEEELRQKAAQHTVSEEVARHYASNIKDR